MRRSLLSLVATLGWILSLQPSALSADLTLFQRYYGTMDYSVTGTGGTRKTGTLDPITEYLIEKQIKLEVPAAADIVAAFLYWHTFQKTNVLPQAIFSQ
jgi:hypothetical protein